MDIDPPLTILHSLYFPAKLKSIRDPVSMLRSLVLITVLRERSRWMAILSGFEPDDLPGVGTYYDFMKRIIKFLIAGPANVETR